MKINDRVLPFQNLKTKKEADNFSEKYKPINGNGSLKKDSQGPKKFVKSAETRDSRNFLFQRAINEIRSPLSCMNLATQFLKEEKDYTTSSIESYIEIISKSVSKIELLLTDLLQNQSRLSSSSL